METNPADDHLPSDGHPVVRTVYPPRSIAPVTAPVAPEQSSQARFADHGDQRQQQQLHSQPHHSQRPQHSYQRQQPPSLPPSEHQQLQQQQQYYRSQEYQQPYSDRDTRPPAHPQDHHSRQPQLDRPEPSHHPEPGPNSNHPQHAPLHRSHHPSSHVYGQPRADLNHVNGDPSLIDNQNRDREGDRESERERERERERDREREKKHHGYDQEPGHGDGSSSSSTSHFGHHPRIRSAPYSFHTLPPGHPSSSSAARPATISHHPNALNRYPFSIPSISAKLDQPAPEDGNDALSTLWKKTTPIQEPYFRTRHAIASQHTLSTLGGVLFSLDEVPTEFTQDIYIAMRNRIFELEAKAVNYSPFSSSRKRSIDRSDEYPGRFGYDLEHAHYSKRPTYADPQPPSRSYRMSERDRPHSPVHRYSSSYPSWYTPEVYTNGSHYAPHHGRRLSEREREHRIEGEQSYEYDSRPGSHPGSPLHPNPQSFRHSTQEARQARFTDERAHGSAQGASYTPSHPNPHQQPPHSLPQPCASQHPSQSQQGPPQPQPQSQPQPQQPLHGYPQPGPPPPHHPQQQQQHRPQHPSQANGSAGPPGQNMAAGTHQSIHQQRHRAQQQAQSAHSRSYHLHKHMRMLDQQRAAQLAVQQQQQQAQQQKQQQQQGHTSKPIQRHYQPHQQMYPVHSHPIPIKPHPAPPAQQQQTQKQQQQQPVLRPNPLQPQQRLTPQQQILHRFQQQRQLQQKQQQLRQLQYLRSRQTAPYPTQKNSLSATTTFGSQSPTPPRVFGSHVDRPIKKSTRPLECSNCMALDSLSWKPRIEPAVTTVTDGAATTTASSSSDSAAEATASGTPAAGSRMLCPACTQYLQAHGKPRPVPPFRTNFLKKVHTRFKRELQEVRFQGWQDAQVLEIEDRMVEREFQIVFNGLDENETSQLQSRPLSAAGSPRPVASTAAVVIDSSAATGSDASIKEGGSTSEASSSAAPAAKETETIVIKIEDDDDVVPSSKVKPDNVEVRTFQSETSVGELFGHRWRTEPVVGYTLVHFGGSDRTRMVPMNPTVPSLTVTFNRSAETITFAFRVLVNGLCLLSSGGGPPALHMPEMADDDESEEEEEEVVVVPDNDKDERSPSPPTTTGDKAAAASGSLGSNHSHVGTPTSIASKEKTPATEAASAGRMEVDMESTSVDVPASEAS